MDQPQQRIDNLDRVMRWLAIGLWLALAVIITVKTLQNPERHSTYPVFREAAQAWWNGVNVYDFDVFGSDYRYGPSFALVMCLLAWLPFRVGALIWALLNVGIAYAATVALCRRVLPGTTTPLVRSLVLIATLIPATHCLYSGQTNLLVFSLLAFAAVAILDQRWWPAALLMAVAVHIKVWPLAGVLLLATCWPRRLAWRLPIALLAVAALPLLVKSPAVMLDQYVQWYQHLIGPSQIRHTYRDAWTIWELFYVPVNAQVYMLLQLGAAATAFGLCLWQRVRLPPQRLVLFSLACWTAWQLVFGPGTERNTFALIAPLTGWALVAALRERRAVWLMGLSYVCTVVAAVGKVEDLNIWFRILHPLGISMFFGWFLWWNHKDCSAGSRPEGSPSILFFGKTTSETSRDPASVGVSARVVASRNSRFARFLPKMAAPPDVHASKLKRQ